MFSKLNASENHERYFFGYYDITYVYQYVFRILIDANLMYWSCISVKINQFICIYIWLIFPPISRSLSRIFGIVFLCSANYNEREIILSLKIFFFKLCTKSDDDPYRCMYFSILQWDHRISVSCNTSSSWLWRSSSKEIENIQLHHEIDPAHVRSSK